jgi:hypothetical protein
MLQIKNREILNLYNVIIGKGIVQILEKETGQEVFAKSLIYTPFSLLRLLEQPYFPNSLEIFKSFCASFSAADSTFANCVNLHFNYRGLRVNFGNLPKSLFTFEEKPKILFNTAFVSRLYSQLKYGEFNQDSFDFLIDTVLPSCKNEANSLSFFVENISQNNETLLLSGKFNLVGRTLYPGTEKFSYFESLNPNYKQGTLIDICEELNLSSDTISFGSRRIVIHSTTRRKYVAQVEEAKNAVEQFKIRVANYGSQIKTQVLQVVENIALTNPEEVVYNEVDSKELQAQFSSSFTFDSLLA